MRGLNCECMSTHMVSTGAMIPLRILSINLYCCRHLGGSGWGFARDRAGNAFLGVGGLLSGSVFALFLGLYANFSRSIVGKGSSGSCLTADRVRLAKDVYRTGLEAGNGAADAGGGVDGLVLEASVSIVNRVTLALALDAVPLRLAGMAVRNQGTMSRAIRSRSIPL